MGGRVVEGCGWVKGSETLGLVTQHGELTTSTTKQLKNSSPISLVLSRGSREGMWESGTRNGLSPGVCSTLGWVSTNGFKLVPRDLGRSISGWDGIVSWLYVSENSFLISKLEVAWGLCVVLGSELVGAILTAARDWCVLLLFKLQPLDPANGYSSWLDVKFIELWEKSEILE